MYELKYTTKPNQPVHAGDLYDYVDYKGEVYSVIVNDADLSSVYFTNASGEKCEMSVGAFLEWYKKRK